MYSLIVGRVLVWNAYIAGSGCDFPLIVWLHLAVLVKYWLFLVHSRVTVCQK